MGGWTFTSEEGTSSLGGRDSSDFRASVFRYTEDRGSVFRYKGKFGSESSLRWGGSGSPFFCCHKTQVINYKRFTKLLLYAMYLRLLSGDMKTPGK